MDPTQKVLRALTEKLEQVEQEILGGRLQSFEMYQGLAHQRQLLLTLIADIKETLADDTDDTHPADNGGSAS